jgi:hypothetical protein
MISTSCAKISKSFATCYNFYNKFIHFTHFTHENAKLSMRQYYDFYKLCNNLCKLCNNIYKLCKLL